ncbi:MAG: 5-(carboxyamino)imidazole ribonucleotide synthase [Pseudomonadota bacterium]
MAGPISSFKTPLAPGHTIGILGGGQLGRMLCVAASRLGFRTAVYADGDENPAFEVAGTTVHGRYDDLKALETFAARIDVLTYEFENVPVAAAQHLETLTPVCPGPLSLSVAQDRLVEKQFISDQGVAVAPFADVGTQAELEAAIAEIGVPSILKTRRLGYDGKGQYRIKSAADAGVALGALNRQPSILEGFVPFEAEISVLIARGAGGESSVYDCPRNHHEGGILRTSTLPSGLPLDVETEAQTIARTIADALGYIGVMGVEFFYVGDGDRSKDRPRLIVNEIAPRVHNSGHWTQDACVCDQFENHIRAICNWPLGVTRRNRDVVMRNLIGEDIELWSSLADDPTATLHLYGKRETRDGRKMGHVNFVGART